MLGYQDFLKFKTISEIYLFKQKIKNIPLKWVHNLLEL